MEKLEKDWEWKSFCLKQGKVNIDGLGVSTGLVRKDKPKRIMNLMEEGRRPRCMPIIKINEY